MYCSLFLCFLAASSEDFASFEARLSSVEQRLQYMEAFSNTLQAPKAAFGPHFLGEDLFAITSEKEYSFDIQTIDLFSARLPSRQRAKRPAVQSFRKQSMHLLVTTDSKGYIQIWNSDQELLKEYDTKSNQQFTASQVHGSNHNVLLLGLASGEVKAFSLAVWREVIEEIEGVKIGVVSHVSLPYPSGDESDEASADVEAADQKEKCEDSPSVTSIGVYIKRSHQKYLVGYANGEVHSFDDNGEWKKKWSSGNDTIHKIVVGPRSETLVLTESGFRMIHSHKMESTSSFCEPPEGITFQDAAFDEKYPDIFYLSTNNGTVYAYRKKAKGCKVLKQMDMESTDVAHVSSIEGNLLVGSTNAFNAFNVSSKRLKNIQKASFRQDFILEEQSENVPVNLLSAVDGYGVASVALQRGNTVSMWEGFVAPAYYGEDSGSGFDLFSFLTGIGRFPVFILIIAAVLGYQWYTRQQRATAFEASKRNSRFDPMQFSDYSDPRMMQQGRKLDPRMMQQGGNLEGLTTRTQELDSEIQRLQRAFEMNKNMNPMAKSKVPRAAPMRSGVPKPSPAMSASKSAPVTATSKVPHGAATTAPASVGTKSESAPQPAPKSGSAAAKAAKTESTI